MPNTISEDEKRNGVRLLWDGVSSKGWRGANKNYFPENVWYIKEGVLHVKGSNGAEASSGGDIVTVDEFHAFDLQFEFQMSEYR